MNSIGVSLGALDEVDAVNEQFHLGMEDEAAEEGFDFAESSSMKKGVSQKLKILIGTYQIASALLDIITIAWPETLLQFMMDISFLNVRSSRACVRASDCHLLPSA